MPLSALVTTAHAGCHRCGLILDAIDRWENVGDVDDYVIGIISGGNGAPTWEGLCVFVSHHESWEHQASFHWAKKRSSPYGHLDFDFELYTEDSK